MWPRCFELSSCQIVHTCILSSFSNVLVIVLSVRRFKTSDYFFRTFKLFLYQSLIDVLLIYSSIYQCCMIFCQVVPLVRERIVIVTEADWSYRHLRNAQCVACDKWPINGQTWYMTNTLVGLEIKSSALSLRYGPILIHDISPDL